MDIDIAMHNAAESGDVKTVRKLIEEGVSVDSRDDLGWTPLHGAAKWGRYEVVLLLIRSKCDINAVDHKGYTPVMLAAYSQKKDVTDLLLRHGAQVSGTNQDGFTLLLYASRNGWANTVQHILNSKEVDVDVTMRLGYTPLMLAAENNPDCIETLLRAGADPNRRVDDFNDTVLHRAVYYGRTRVVRLLLGVDGLDLNHQDDDGQTPLHLASIHGYREILKEILEAGADCTIRDKRGETALSEGIRRMELTLEDIRLFVQKGAFFEEREYVLIFQDSILKESVLKDVNLCTQSVVNKFHLQSLPALKSIRYCAEQLPNIDKFKLNDREIDEVEELVKCEIGRSNFCNVLKVHPMSLKALCILTLIAC